MFYGWAVMGGGVFKEKYSALYIYIKVTDLNIEDEHLALG